MTIRANGELEPLSYDSTLSLEEAKAALDEVQHVMDVVSAKYAVQAGSDQEPPTLMAKEDNAILSSCLGVLLPLQLQESVQLEFKSAKPSEQENTVLARSAMLMQESMLEAARFSNTGVTAFYGERQLQPPSRRVQPTRLISAPSRGGLVERIRRRIGG